jgi:hypothetical protein
MASFNDLPAEIRLRIASCLYRKDLTALARINTAALTKLKTTSVKKVQIKVFGAQDIKQHKTPSPRNSANAA